MQRNLIVIINAFFDINDKCWTSHTCMIEQTDTHTHTHTLTNLLVPFDFITEKFTHVQCLLANFEISRQNYRPISLQVKHNILTNGSYVGQLLGGEIIYPYTHTKIPLMYESNHWGGVKFARVFALIQTHDRVPAKEVAHVMLMLSQNSHSSLACCYGVWFLMQVDSVG